MASLISAEDISSFTGDFQDLFDTFKRDILIYKEPKKIIQNINTNTYHGYGEAAQKTNFSYVPVFETHQAVISYKDRQEAGQLDADVGLQYFAGDVRIKVDEAARNFISHGKTEKIVIDGKDFNVLTEDAIKNFFGLKLYVFHLRFTK